MIVEDNNVDPKLAQFLKELSELSNTYGYRVLQCNGCCCTNSVVKKVEVKGEYHVTNGRYLSWAKK